MAEAEDFVIYCLRCGKFDENCLLCSAMHTACRPPTANSGEFWVRGPSNSMQFGQRRLKTPDQLGDVELDGLRQALLVRDIRR